jgi:hypothetical protein
VPSTSDAMAAIETLRRFLYATSSSDTAQEQLMAVESFIVQSRVDINHDFFNKNKKIGFFLFFKI